MNTTSRLLLLWERFPETRAERLDWSERSRRFFIDSTPAHNAHAHAIAGWRLLELLWEGQRPLDGYLRLTVPSWQNGQPMSFGVASDQINRQSEDGVVVHFVSPQPTRLDALISAYWASKGEQEPSE